VKVGDLVTHRMRITKKVGLVTEVGLPSGYDDVKVLWVSHQEPIAQNSTYLKVLTAS